jgi:hypothetical protein
MELNPPHPFLNSRINNIRNTLESEVTGMDPGEYEGSGPEGFKEMISGMDACRIVRGWPEDELSGWVASHRDEVKRALCDSSEHENASFCRGT